MHLLSELALWNISAVTVIATAVVKQSLKVRAPFFAHRTNLTASDVVEITYPPPPPQITTCVPLYCVFDMFTTHLVYLVFRILVHFKLLSKHLHH